ncbi:MAG: TIGR04552 family protein [Deltaproteobacteria bacterium]|nr:TIGR04552 family protein [Deltaproteobacteria bacterium]
MIVRLTLGEMERAYLVLRGGSVLDWRRLNVASRAECETILRVNGFDPRDADDRVRLNEIRLSAINYLERTFEFAFASEIRNAESVTDLMLMAAGSDVVLRRQACAVLKVMLVVHHIEARELKSRLNISDHALFHLLEDKAARVISEMQDQGYPIIDFQSSRKTHDSIITKLLSKRHGNRAMLYDMLRFRIVTATMEEIVPVVAYLSQHLFPFHYTVPGESRNSLFNLRDYIRRHPRISKIIPEFQVDLLYENEMHATSNPDTSDTFKTINFIVGLPLRLEDRQLDIWAPGLKLPSRVVHVLAEFQVVDQVSYRGNERGDASHKRYKSRQLTKVRQRLLGA